MMAERLAEIRRDLDSEAYTSYLPKTVRELLDHIDGLKFANGVLDSAAKDAQAWLYEAQTAKEAYCELLEANRVTEAEGGAIAQLNGMIDELRAQLEAQRGGAVVASADDACPRVEQSVLHVPGVSRGNCFSATVAGLLKLPIESIPQFAATDDKSWQEQFNEWLRQFGLAWFPMAGDDLAGECQQFGIQGLWAEMSGKSPRFDVGHSCAAKDGRLAWDPHPSQSGLEHPIWWHGVFLALKPWEAVLRMADLRFANCKLCGHPLKGNDHGFDQCDADVNNNGELVHSGRCTHCKECRIQPIPADRVLGDGMVGVDREEWEVTSALALRLAHWYTGHEINRTIWPPELQRYRAIDALRAQQAKGE